jgi:hypothetical protein
MAMEADDTPINAKQVLEYVLKKLVGYKKIEQEVTLLTLLFLFFPADFSDPADFPADPADTAH